MQRLYRIAAAALGWFTLALQYDLTMQGKSGAEAVEETIRFFGFFTILSNIFVALALTLPWLAPGSRLGRFFSQATVRTAIASYIIIAAIIYHSLLRQLWNPEGLQFLADTLEHDVMPALYLIDWLVFVPKGTLTPGSVPAWLTFPVVYAADQLIQGAGSDDYPYPFLDVGKLGYDRVLINMAGLVLVFAGLGLLLVAIDYGLGRWRRQEAR